MSKSQLFLSSNVGLEASCNLFSEFGIPRTLDLRVYLAMPLLHKRVGQGTYHFLVENVSSKLSGWKGRTISMATLTLLVQTSSSRVANYAMQTSLLPV